jgi:hypothetical protein
VLVSLSGVNVASSGFGRQNDRLPASLRSPQTPSVLAGSEARGYRQKGRDVPHPSRSVPRTQTLEAGSVPGMGWFRLPATFDGRHSTHGTDLKDRGRSTLHVEHPTTFTPSLALRPYKLPLNEPHCQRTALPVILDKTRAKSVLLYGHSMRRATIMRPRSRPNSPNEKQRGRLSCLAGEARHSLCAPCAATYHTNDD